MGTFCHCAMSPSSSMLSCAAARPALRPAWGPVRPVIYLSILQLLQALMRTLLMRRYFAEACASLACMVIGTRDTKAPGNTPSRDYWITDGLYGSMNCILYDHATLTAHRLPPPADIAGRCGSDAVLPSTVFGPTCDGLDTVLRDWPLPEMENGDWLVFPNMGAYSLVGACNFNGIDVISTPTFYVCSAASA